MPALPDPARPAVQTVLDERYRLDEELGRGSAGQVFRAEQLDTGRIVAVKVLDPSVRSPHRRASAADREFAARFAREASVLAALEHPNTVRMLDYGETAFGPYLVMEFVDGTTLQGLFDQDIEPVRLVRLLRQVCHALTEAHQIGLVHRDLKPSNVLVTRVEGAEQVKVVDFGLVKITGHREDDDEATQRGQIVGTPLYMAPEQVRGLDLDGRADIYALGAILFQGLTGRPPFEGGKAAATLIAHLMEPPPDLVAHRPDQPTPSELVRTVERSLAKRTADRFQTTEELADALTDCERSLLALQTGTEPPTLPPEMPAPSTPVPDAASPRHPWVGTVGLLSLVAVALAAAAVAAWWTLLGSS